MEATVMRWFIINVLRAKEKGYVMLGLFILFPLSAFSQEAVTARTAVVRSDTIVRSSVADTIPDSVIICRAKALGMVDSSEVNACLRRYQRMEQALAQVVDTAAWNHGSARYVRNKEKAYRRWMRLIPNQATLQYAGSIGMLSAGFGWHYGRGEHWETDILIGFLPRYHSEAAHATYTIKECYVPWHCHLSSRWTLEPLTAGLFFNTISGPDFWRRQPDKYPKHYYGFSTKVRSNIFLGQRIRYRIPSRHRFLHSAVSAYYELSSCDLYIVSKAVNKSYPWRETLSLAFGLRWEM